MAGAGPTAGARLDTREALLVAFFATFIVVAKAALRLNLHVPGHAMFFTLLFLVLARACVPRFGAATLTGALAGAASALLGMGRGGPLIALGIALPGLVVDLAGALPGGRAPGWLRGAAVGAVAGATAFASNALADLLAGMPLDLVAQHALISAGGKAAFGALGGAAGAAIADRLRGHGLIP
jgi:hypothetical protein